MASRELIHLLSAAERLVRRRLAGLLGEAGVSVEQWRVMSLLADGAGHTMTEVADFALLPGPTLTKLVDGLVSDNIVYRRVDQLDRRRVRIYLTPRGRETHEILHQLVADHHDELLAPTDAEERALLEALLLALVNEAPQNPRH
jgi:DNA-binding MarR family transcriptional regulator